jgi:tRNA(Ile)-lysidine synthase
MLDHLTIERMLAKAGDKPVLVALSGGGDSVALLHLLAENLGAARLRAVVVDHALREGSEADARKAAEIAKVAGVSAEVTTLSWAANTNRAHEAAREARYAALCAIARKLGARVIATGHTRDDQAETVLLRAARGSGLRGLAAMRALAPAPIWPEGRGLWLARPLLSARRDALRDYLRTRRAVWIEDPANANEVYARVRARRVLAELADAGLDPTRFAMLAEQLAAHTRAVDEAAASLIHSAAEFVDDEVRIARVVWRGDIEVRRRALSTLVTAAGAGQREPAGDQVASLEDSIANDEFSGATLAGAVVQVRRANTLVLRRDRGALEGRADGAQPLAPLALPAAQEVIWDRRVALTAPEAGWSVVFENGAALLARGEERAALAAASPHWLLKERVQHVLGMD